MSDFVYGNGPVPETKHDPNPAPPDSTGYATAADFNLLGGNELSIRTAILGGHYFGLQNGASSPAPSAGTSYVRSNGGKVQVSENGLAWANLEHYYSPEQFRAANDGTTDDTAAINAMFAAMRAAGGGCCLFRNSGKAYRITGQMLYGVRFVDEADVTLTALGYPNSVSYSAQNATSWDPSAYATAHNVPAIEIFFEPGAAVWCDFAPGVETAAFYYGAAPNGQVANNGNQANGRICGMTLLARDQYNGSQFVQVAGLTAVTTLVSGIFSPFCQLLKVEKCQMWGLNRAIVTSDAYWGTVRDNSIFRCQDGVTCFQHNAAHIGVNLVQYAQTRAHLYTGQGVNVLMPATQQCAVDLEIPVCDNLEINSTYFEDTTSTHTDYSVKLGQNSGGLNCVGLKISNLHASRYATSGHILMKSSLVEFDCCRFFDTGAGRSTISDANTFPIFINSELPLDSSGTTYASHLQRIFNRDGIQDRLINGLKLGNALDVETGDATLHQGVLNLKPGTPWVQAVQSAGEIVLNRGDVASSGVNFYTGDNVNMAVSAVSGDMLFTADKGESAAALVAVLYRAGIFKLLAAGGTIQADILNTANSVGLQLKGSAPDDGTTPGTSTDNVPFKASGPIHAFKNNGSSKSTIEYDGAAILGGRGLFTSGLASGVVNATHSSSPVTMDAGLTVLNCNAASGVIVGNLPAVSSNRGRVYVVKKTDSTANTVTLTPAGSDKIDGASTFVLTDENQYIVLVADGGTFWQIAAKSPINYQVSVTPGSISSGTAYVADVACTGLKSGASIAFSWSGGGPSAGIILQVSVASDDAAHVVLYNAEGFAITVSAQTINITQFR